MSKKGGGDRKSSFQKKVQSEKRFEKKANTRGGRYINLDRASKPTQTYAGLGKKQGGKSLAGITGIRTFNRLGKEYTRQVQAFAHGTHLPSSMYLYRGFSDNKLSNMTLKRGITFRTKQLTSTSMSQKHAQALGGSHTLFRIRAKAGAKGALSGAGGHEVILPRGATFTVKNVRKVGGTRVVDLSYA